MMQSLIKNTEARLDFVAAILQGLKDMEEGRVHDAREALEELGNRLGIPKEPQETVEL